MADLIIQPDYLQGLRALSARFGSDPMHIQGAGGNSSFKDGDVMWVKASGTQMADALEKDIFIATDLPKMRAALANEDPTADLPACFVLGQGLGLRPSIETSLHAVFDQKIVLHSHCIHTLSYAVQKNAEEKIGNRLDELNWCFVDYAKPGAALARSVRAALRKDTNIVVLGNHGLIVAGETAEEVAKLQVQVHSSLANPILETKHADVQHLQNIAKDSDFELPEDPLLHQLALDPRRVAQVAEGSLYPDHVIFCGMAVPVLGREDCLASALFRDDQTRPLSPLWCLVPGRGVLVRKTLKTSTRIMMRCLADVMAHVPFDARLNYLSEAQNHELLEWDAEKYRQSLNRD